MTDILYTENKLCGPILLIGFTRLWATAESLQKIQANRLINMKVMKNFFILKARSKYNTNVFITLMYLTLKAYENWARILSLFKKFC